MCSGLIFLVVSLVYHRHWTQDLSMVGLARKYCENDSLGPLLTCLMATISPVAISMAL